MGIFAYRRVRRSGEATESASILARMREAAQSAASCSDHLDIGHEYAFLVGQLIDWPTLRRAEAQAASGGIPIHHVLLAAGWVSQTDYAVALARLFVVPCVLWDSTFEIVDIDQAHLGSVHEVNARIDGLPWRVLLASGATPRALSARVAALRDQGHHVALASQFCIDATVERHLTRRRMNQAVRRLRRDRPDSSARSPAPMWQPLLALGILGALLGGIVVLPSETLVMANAGAALAFLCITLLRVAALREVACSIPQVLRRKRADPPRLPDAALPFYSILVPLYQEAGVLPGLVRSLRALDYPLAKLEVILVLEAVDVATLGAMLDIELPGNFRTVVVPDGGPRTKPKALNYALAAARGEYVVVYDAEDRPQADQLRRAVDAFRRADPQLACVQARLNIYNPRQSWLTRGLMAQTPVVGGSLADHMFAPSR